MLTSFHRSITHWLVAICCVGCNSRFVDPPVGTRPDRKLGFGVTEGTVGYELAFASAKNAGIQFIELPQQWDEVETEPKKFKSEFAAMANQVYPALDTSIVLSLNPIDTNLLRVPAHLQDFAWDSPERIESFCKFADWTLDQLPAATIQSISIGNEVDAWFVSHPDVIEGYTAFFESVRNHILAKHSNIPVGVKITFNGRVGEAKSTFDRLEESADVCMLTYYPLDESFQVRPPSSIELDFAKMIEAANGKPVHLLEAGYPSGSQCGSSLDRQAEFIDAMFVAWDKHIDDVPVINFVWTCDLSQAEVDAMTKYYRVDLPAFAGYLGTLGLQKNDGTSKPAWIQLRDNLAKRAE